MHNVLAVPLESRFNPSLAAPRDFLDNRFRPEIVQIEIALGSDPRIGDTMIRYLNRVVNGNPEGPHQLERFLQHAGSGGEQLMRLYNRVLNGNPAAQFVLGALYARGVALSRDEARADQLFGSAERFSVPCATEYRQRLADPRRSAA